MSLKYFRRESQRKGRLFSQRTECIYSCGR